MHTPRLPEQGRPRAPARLGVQSRGEGFSAAAPSLGVLCSGLREQPWGTRGLGAARHASVVLTQRASFPRLLASVLTPPGSVRVPSSPAFLLDASAVPVGAPHGLLHINPLPGWQTLLSACSLSCASRCLFLTRSPENALNPIGHFRPPLGLLAAAFSVLGSQDKPIFPLTYRRFAT